MANKEIEICETGILCVYKDKCPDGCRETRGPVIDALMEWYRGYDFCDIDEEQGAWRAIKEAESIVCRLDTIKAGLTGRSRYE